MTLRQRLIDAIGQTVTLRRGTTGKGSTLHGQAGTLTDVRRTRCTIDFGQGIGPWDVPMHEVLPPDQYEPDPNQLSLFGSDQEPNP